MVRYFGIGTGIAVIVVVSALALGNWSLLFKLSGSIGLISMLAAAIFMGIFSSGDRIRANYSNETLEVSTKRRGLSTKLVLFGLPNLVASIIYLIFYR